MTSPTIAKPLFPYQEKAVSATETSLQLGNAVVLVLPTGSGKTLIAARIAAGFRRVLFVAHRREILDQAKKDMPANVRCLGIVAALQVDPKDFDLLIIDECHRSGAARYRTLIEKFGHASLLGLTATPLRLDGQGLSHAFDAIVEGPTVGELLASRHLAPYVPIEAPDVALEKIGALKVIHGDYDRRKLGAIMNRPRLVGSVPREYLKWANGRKAIAFAVNIEHSRALEAALIARGVRAKHIDGRASENMRRSALKDLAAGRIDVLCSVNLFTEGWDCPEVSCVIMARPTRSLTLYLQSVGRGMRICDGKKDLIILDHAGNMARHGAPDEEREWSLEGAAQKARRLREIEELERIYSLGFNSLEDYQLGMKRLRDESYSAVECSAMFHIEYGDLFRRSGLRPIKSKTGTAVRYSRAEVDSLVLHAGISTTYRLCDCVDLLHDFIKDCKDGTKAADKLLRRHLVRPTAIRGYYYRKDVNALLQKLKGEHENYYSQRECADVLGVVPSAVIPFLRKLGVSSTGRDLYLKVDVDPWARGNFYTNAECVQMLGLRTNTLGAFLARRGVTRIATNMYRKSEIDLIVREWKPGIHHKQQKAL